MAAVKENALILGEVIKSIPGSERIVVLNAANQTIYRGYAAEFAENSHINPMRKIKRMGIGMETYKKEETMWDWEHSKKMSEQIPMESIPEYEIGDLRQFVFMKIQLSNDF